MRLPSFLPLVLSAAVWVSCGVYAPPVYAEEDSVRPTHLIADKVEATPDKLTAEGNVNIDIDGARLLCNYLSLNRETGEIMANGECVLYWQDSFVAADWLTYNPKTKVAIMHRASGQGTDFNGNSLSQGEDVYFWADTLTWTPEKMAMDDVAFTTCSEPTDALHYQFKSDHVDVKPNQSLIASNAALYLNGKHVYTLPTLNVSLEPKHRRRRSRLPQVGSNSNDGMFIRTSMDYALSNDNYGSILLDYYGKTGLGAGIQHLCQLGDKGDVSFYYYRQGSDKINQRYELRNKIEYAFDENTHLEWEFTTNHSETPGFDTPNNLNSVLTFTNKTDTSDLRFSQNYNKSGTDRSNSTWRLYYNIKLAPELSAIWNADLATSRTESLSRQRFHYIGGLRHESELFDSELMYENTTGDATYFFNRKPELTLRSHPIYVGDVPFLVSAGMGWAEEGPSLYSTARTDLKIQVPDQTIDYGSGRFMVGAGLRQFFYGSGDSQYHLAARAGWLQELGDVGTIRLDYNWLQPKGTTPFQHDYVTPYENLTGGIEFRDTDTYSFSVLGGYNLRSNTFHSITPKLDIKPGANITLSAASSYDPNTSIWRSVDTGLKLQLTPEFAVSHWSVYDLINSRFTYQDYQVDYEAHDWITSLVYRGVQNEFYLQFSLKAFPQITPSIGTNALDPVLPKDMQNSFIR